jgi:hypothetical protein
MKTAEELSQLIEQQYDVVLEASSDALRYALEGDVDRSTAANIAAIIAQNDVIINLLAKIAGVPVTW